MTAAIDVPAAASGPVRVIGAAAAGNLLEWYDWSVYGFLITYIGLNFFPAGAPDATLLLTFAAFGAGFLMRPIGACAAGWIGETHGRKAALQLTLLVMAAGTVPIAFIPNHASIGMWAPVLLVLCRLLQGLSTGGELGGALAFLAEWAPEGRRGLYVSLQQASTHGGTLLGSGVAASLNGVLSPEQMADWGWRVPFLLGGAILPVAIWLRAHMGETPLYLAARRQPAARTNTVPRLGLAIGLIAGPVAAQYLLFTYLAAFAVRHGGLAESAALAANTAALAVLMVCTPAMGALSDRIGRRPLLAAASVAVLLAAGPAFACVGAAPGIGTVLAIQAGLALVVAMFHGAGPVAVAELFPTQGRALLVSVAYGAGVALAGGFAPFAATWLIGRTGSTTSPALYLAAACAITALAVARMPETAHGQLS